MNPNARDLFIIDGGQFKGFSGQFSKHDDTGSWGERYVTSLGVIQGFVKFNYNAETSYEYEDYEEKDSKEDGQNANSQS